MAISATTGATASNTTATTTLAFAAISIASGQDLVVGVALADTTKTVTGIADTAGNTFALRAAINGTGVRSELWEVQATIANASDVITITFSGATLAAAAFEEYASTIAQTAVNDYAPHNMTDDVTPAPYVVTYSSNYPGRNGWHAFDGNYTGGEGAEWLGQNGGTDYLSIDLGIARTPSSYAITVTNSVPYGSNRAPKTWTLRGSTDNFSTFTVLDTQASQTGWAAGERRTFTIPSPASFRYYRINVTANQGADPTYTGILEMNYFGSGLLLSTPQNTATNSGSDQDPRVRVSQQEQSNWMVGALAFVCNSGDTVAALDGALRRSVVPALTSVGIALIDNAGVYGAVSMPVTARLSAARAWAAAGVELRSGGFPLMPYADYVGVLPLFTTTKLLHCLEPPMVAAPGSPTGSGGPSVQGWAY